MTDQANPVSFTVPPAAPVAGVTSPAPEAAMAPAPVAAPAPTEASVVAQLTTLETLVGNVRSAKCQVAKSVDARKKTLAALTAAQTAGQVRRKAFEDSEKNAVVKEHGDDAAAAYAIADAQHALAEHQAKLDAFTNPAT